MLDKPFKSYKNGRKAVNQIHNPNASMINCIHKEDAYCFIGKTPCEQECIFADILDNVSIGIIGLDIVKNLVIYRNKFALRVLNDIKNLYDYKALVLFLFQDFEAFLSSDKSSFSRELNCKSRIIGYTVYRISDRYLWINVKDITEKVRLESIAEAVNTMNNIGYIFSGIRHEIGNPINSIKMTMSVLRNNVDKYSKETVIEYIDRSLADINRVEYLLKSLKNFSIYERPDLQNVPMSSFTEKLLALVSSDFKKHGIKIKTIVHPEAEWIHADSRALHQVLLNVLTNAADALEGKRNPEIVLSVFEMANQITVSVEDNGCGMSDHEQKDLFKPFYTSKSKGTGLGLVIAKKMLSMMNGTIKIRSTKDLGTVVDISLPQGTGEKKFSFKN